MGRLLGIATQTIQADRLAWRLMRRVAGTRTLSSRATIDSGFAGRQTFISTSGNAGLAKGGTGDVLTGISRRSLRSLARTTEREF